MSMIEKKYTKSQTESLQFITYWSSVNSLKQIENCVPENDIT